MKTLFASLFLVVLFAFTQSSAVAQCPTDYTCPWSAGPAPITVSILNPSTGVYCEAKVYYCYRICNGSLDTYISSIEFVDASCANGINVGNAYVFETALEGIFTANPWGGFTNPFVAPPCSTATGYYRQMYLATCWKTRLYDGKASIEACSSVLGCVTSYRVCWDYSQSPAKLVVSYDGIITTINECEEPDAGPWVISTSAHPCAAFCPQ